MITKILVNFRVQIWQCGSNISVVIQKQGNARSGVKSQKVNHSRFDRMVEKGSWGHFVEVVL